MIEFRVNWEVNGELRLEIWMFQGLKSTFAPID